MRWRVGSLDRMRPCIMTSEPRAHPSRSHARRLSALAPVLLSGLLAGQNGRPTVDRPNSLSRRLRRRVWGLRRPTITELARGLVGEDKDAIGTSRRQMACQLPTSSFWNSPGSVTLLEAMRAASAAQRAEQVLRRLFETGAVRLIDSLRDASPTAAGDGPGSGNAAGNLTTATGTVLE